MKKILGLLTALLLATPVIADDVALHGGTEGSAFYVWVVIDDDVYFCKAYGQVENPVCHKAEMKD
jgi:hypothetical protein